MLISLKIQKLKIRDQSEFIKINQQISQLIIPNKVMLRDFFFVQQNERVGFMSGFEWSRKSAIDYDNFIQMWNGPRQLQKKIFRIIHKQLQITRDFPQHYAIQLYYFIVSILATLNVGFMAYAIYALVAFGNVDLISIAAVTNGIVFFARFSRFVVVYFGNRSLRVKIRRTLQKCNPLLNKYGYQLKLPQYSKKWCFCIPCCDLCFKDDDIWRIDIVDLTQKRISDLYFMDEIQLTTMSTKSTSER